MDLYNKLSVYKFDLIKLLIRGKSSNSSYFKKLKETFILVDTLMKRIKNEETIDCTAEIKAIDEFISKTK